MPASSCPFHTNVSPLRRIQQHTSNPDELMPTSICPFRTNGHHRLGIILALTAGSKSRARQLFLSLNVVARYVAVHLPVTNHDVYVTLTQTTRCCTLTRLCQREAQRERGRKGEILTIIILPISRRVSAGFRRLRTTVVSSNGDTDLPPIFLPLFLSVSL